MRRLLLVIDSAVLTLTIIAIFVVVLFFFHIIIRIFLMMTWWHKLRLGIVVLWVRLVALVMKLGLWRTALVTLGTTTSLTVNLVVVKTPSETGVNLHTMRMTFNTLSAVM